jgi:hypothetical protein
VITHLDIRQLRNVIDEARIILNNAVLPDGRAREAKELLARAVTMADELIARPTIAEIRRRNRI